ncbi:serine/threonine protein kinase [Nostoc sp. FACHB-152]|uniref:serine/threonine protein kinase n=1 Tax=unclassified Nostoc TaxID=2593658 RepID=UPI001688C96D|nr:MULTISPECIES: serine/threonine-protein kinase [unclassified Nostoc]MBD2449932.1 serine/threonine protein kinase [Nostoc sp. FACHB-152]MBD2471392.1 serine/threonine protein kinase [Nostoc sp. FACHB-145]
MHGNVAVHCINPDCQRPYPQPWGNKFCNSCGALLQLLDRYVPLQPLGSGGFAQIYTVWDEKTQTEKVLKVLVEDSPKAQELFTQEAAVLISLQHPGVPRVEADGFFQVNLSSPKQRQLACLVMEKINGPTLDEILDSYPQGCPENLVLNWFTQAVKILQELHKCQIIHRDIKPSNLMLRIPASTAPPTQARTGWEQLVLIDFGGVKQFNSASQRRESSSTRLFSSGYSPPEQVTGSNVGPAADFYALGRTMIELLTGKYPPELEDLQTGELRWRNRVTVNPQFADLLDEMVKEDVRSRPANAAIILKRVAKISRPTKLGFFSQLQNFVNQTSNQTNNNLSLLTQTIERALATCVQAVGKTILFIAKAFLKIIQACLATIWAMLLSGLGACVGTIVGFFLAYRTILGDRIVELILSQLPEVVANSQNKIGANLLLFAIAGLGTAWGLTTSGCFGQRRRFLVASIMGIISYGFGWLFWELLSSKQSSDGLVAMIAVSVFLLSLSFRFRSHHIVYALVAAFGTASIFSVLFIVGFPTTVLQFSNQPLWSELGLPLALFGFVAILMSFWLGISHYLIVPGLRFLGWR